MGRLQLSRIQRISHPSLSRGHGVLTQAQGSFLPCLLWCWGEADGTDSRALAVHRLLGAHPEHHPSLPHSLHSPIPWPCPSWTRANKPGQTLTPPGTPWGLWPAHALTSGLPSCLGMWWCFLVKSFISSCWDQVSLDIKGMGRDSQSLSPVFGNLTLLS